MCNHYSPLFIQICYAADRNYYLNQLYTINPTAFNNLYANFFPVPTIGYPLASMITDLLTITDFNIASYLNSNMLCYENRQIILSGGSLSSILSSIGFDHYYREFLNTLDPVTLATMFEAYDQDAFATKIFTIFPVGGGFDWNAFFSNQSGYYATMLTYYPIWAGYTQDQNNYYSMTDYFQWIRNKWGDTYYNSLVERFYDASRKFTEKYSVSEFDIYGSSRLGVDAEDFLIKYKIFEADYSFITVEYSNIVNDTDSSAVIHYNYKTLVRGHKRYEFSNHLGNVLVIISDKRITLCSGDTVVGYEVDVISATDYTAFGSPLIGSTLNSISFRYDFYGRKG